MESVPLDGFGPQSLHAHQAVAQAADSPDAQQWIWQKTRADAQAKVAELKARAERRANEIDSDIAESDADMADVDASAALDYADWAVENARVAILDAIDARVGADEKATALV